MAYEILGSVVRDGTWVVRGVDIVSATARSRNTSAYYKVDAGIRKDGNTTWLGSWSQSAKGLSAGTATTLLDTAKYNTRIPPGSAPVVRITKVGSPSDIVGSSVTFRLFRVGDSRGSLKPALNTPATDDPAVRAVIDHINSSASETVISVPLVAETNTVEAATAATYADTELTTKSVNSASYIDLDATITVTVPTGKSVYVMVTGQCEARSSSASLGSYAYLAIGDGSSESGELQAFTADSSKQATITVAIAETITADTTYILRGKYGTRAWDADDQRISALAIAL